MTRSQLEEIVKIRRDVVVEVGRCFGYYFPLNSFKCFTNSGGKWSLSFVSHHQGGGQCLEKQQVTVGTTNSKVMNTLLAFVPVQLL